MAAVLEAFAPGAVRRGWAIGPIAERAQEWEGEREIRLQRAGEAMRMRRGKDASRRAEAGISG